MKRRKLSRSMIITVIFFSIFLSALVGFIGFRTYLQGMIVRYETYIDGVLQISLMQIDGDDMEHCLATNTESEQYQKTREFLNQMKLSHEIAYIYGIIPLNLEETDNMKYLITGVTPEELAQGIDVGLGKLSGSEYTPNVVQYYFDSMNGADETTYFSNNTEFGYMYTGMRPIYNTEGEAIAVLSVDIGMNEIANTYYRYLAIVSLSSIILMVLFSIVMYFWMNRRIIKPIISLEQSARGFVENCHSVSEPEELTFIPCDIHTGDEIQMLSDSLLCMSDDIKSYMTNLLKETKEKEKIQSELSVATQIQADMLPSIFPPYPDRKEIDIYATMTPAKEVGGDFYDFFLIDENHLGLVIADVSGKGVPAALFMVIAKTLIKNSAGSSLSPKEILEKVNKQLCENNESEMFVTVWMGIMELSSGRVVAANAGHEYPAVKNAEGQFELIKDKHGFVLAAMDMAKYTEYEFTLGRGETLFVYTDGVPEATNAQNELFGTDRMLKALNQEPDETPEKILSNVRAVVDEFVGEAPQFDDLTMLCVKYYGVE